MGIRFENISRQPTTATINPERWQAQKGLNPEL
jgi:hypothetical protein